MTCIINTEDFDEGFLVKIRKAEKKIFLSDREKKVRDESVIGRALLGYMLERDYGIKNFCFGYGENEKPYLKNEDVFFNISHSGTYIMCSTDDCEIGCDIQQIKPYNPKVAKKFYCRNECSVIENSPDSSKTFIRIWALKESILKKEGTGIQGGLSSYDFSRMYTSDSFFSFGNYFTALSIDGYEAAVCSEREKESIEFTEKGEFEKYIDSINVEST